MNDLFPIEETLSPRLKWMAANGIRTYKNDYMSRPWMAIGELGAYERGDTEEEALIAFAKKLNLKLWNES